LATTNGVVSCALKALGLGQSSTLLDVEAKKLTLVNFHIISSQHQLV